MPQHNDCESFLVLEKAVSLVSGFKTLSLNDQVKLIQSSIYPIELLMMSEVYDSSTKKYNFFTYTDEEEAIILEKFPMLRVFQVH